MIESRQNSKIKWLFKLQQKKFRDKSETFLVYGDNSVNEALKTGKVLELYTSNKNKEGVLISETLIKNLSPHKSPVDILAIVKKPKSKKYSNKILILDGIQDPGNLGTLIRSAIGFNFKTIIASEDTVDFYNEKTISATQGNLFYANLVRNNLIEEIENLKKSNYKILLTDLKKGNTLKKINKNDKIAVVLGNEGTGVKEEIKKLADDYVVIKTNKIDSLNVAIAGSIIMYEVSGLND